MNKYIRVHSYVFKFSQLPRWSVCIENQLLVRQRKMDRSGFVVRNPVADLSVQKMRAIYFKQLSKRGETHHRQAKSRVVRDLQKESYGRPNFTCADRENPCSLWMWADQNQVEKPNCYHG